MNLIEAIDQAIELGMLKDSVIEAVLNGEYLNKIGKTVDAEKEYLCLMDMGKRKITILGEKSS